MTAPDAIWVSPFSVTHKLSCDLDETEAGEWVGKTYAPLDETIKHRAVQQRYVGGQAWEDTDLFTQIYPRRFAAGQVVRGCASLAALAAQYYDRVDGMFADLRTRGFRAVVDGEPTAIPALIGPGGHLVIGNNGNHRLAMAKALKLEKVLVTVKGELADVGVPFEPCTFQPAMHAGARKIPAMTTPAERMAYYELARQLAVLGEVVELGTWLGAATCYIAAGVRDSRVPGRVVQSYDRFEWRPAHEMKAGGPINQSMMAEVESNLGPLGAHVALRRGEILQAAWSGAPIGLLVADGPKRVREIAYTLATFGTHLPAGACMAWQDFAYFPAYDIPACLARLEATGKIEFAQAVFPGTTVVFRVLQPFARADVAERRFSLEHWRPEEILETWTRWRPRLAPALQSKWMTGCALFLVDRGATPQAVTVFREALEANREPVETKWRYMCEQRPAFAVKYRALGACL